MFYTTHYASPIGGITIASNGDAITGLWFDGQKYFGSTLPPEHACKPLPVLWEAALWLDAYFQGKQPDFLPPLLPLGTAFRKKVWALLMTIPYGQTCTYGELAAELAKQYSLSAMSPRAVGSAVGRNPISLMIPCHRVIGHGGVLRGYAGGIEKKAFLLQMEKAGSSTPLLR